MWFYGYKGGSIIYGSILSKVNNSAKSFAFCVWHLESKIEELVSNCNVMNLTVSGTLTISFVAIARWQKEGKR